MKCPGKGTIPPFKAERNVGKKKARPHVVGEIVLECKENKQSQSLEKENRLEVSGTKVMNWFTRICDMVPVMSAWHRVGGCSRSKHWAERKLVRFLKSNHLPQHIRILCGTSIS